MTTKKRSLHVTTGYPGNTHLTQEHISIEAHTLHLLASSLINQVGKMGPHTDIDSLPHLCWQGPQFLLMLLQGLLIELHTQESTVSQRLYACRKDKIDIFRVSFLSQVLIIIFREWICVLAEVKRSLQSSR